MANDRKVIAQHKRPKLKGRQGIHSFLRLPHFLIESKEFADLSANAVKLLLDIAKLYRGNNNGDISAAWSRLSKEGWAAENTMRRALHELLEAGFLVTTRHGVRKRCSLYGITWEPIDKCPGKSLEIKEERVASQLWRQSRTDSKQPSRR